MGQVGKDGSLITAQTIEKLKQEERRLRGEISLVLAATDRQKDSDVQLPFFHGQAVSGTLVGVDKQSYQIKVYGLDLESTIIELKPYAGQVLTNPAEK
jgi:hypothetical protein